MTLLSGPPPAVLEVDGFAWRPASDTDAATLEGLAAQGANRAIFSLPASEAEFVIMAGRPGFRIPMICWAGTEAIGVAATTSRSHHDLNLRLICFFRRPVPERAPVAAYVRHLFWSLPLHRIYVQLPLLEDADDYVRLLKLNGFQEEGVVRRHALVGGVPCDVAMLGVLRREFDEWCLRSEKRLAL